MPKALKYSTLFLLLAMPFLLWAQIPSEPKPTTTGLYIIWFFIILFGGLLPITSVNSYRQTGASRYKSMALISISPTILFSGYACLMSEPPYLYYYLAIILVGFLLIAGLFFGLEEEDEEE